VSLAAVEQVVGLGRAFGLTRLIEGLLFGVSLKDPVARIVTAPRLLTAVALAAHPLSGVPAR